jgi:hypothetical protein
MDDQENPRSPADLEPVTGRLAGGSFQRLPVLPIVGLVAFLFGFSAGFALAPKTIQIQPEPTVEPSDTPTPPASAMNAFPAESWPPGVGDTPVPIATPATGGLTLPRVIALITNKRAIDESRIVSVTLIDGNGAYHDRSTQRWEWEIVLRGGQAPCKADDLIAFPVASDTCYFNRSIVLVDYFTGEMLLES